MQIVFNNSLEHQTNAIESVVKLFDGNMLGCAMDGVIVKNKLTLSDIELFENLIDVQQQNGISETNINNLKDFSLEMETGTGKTYTYLKTILSLKKKYNFTKFVIVVPSVAIREGVLKSIEITKQHFKQLFPNTNFKHFVYDSKQLGEVREFVSSNTLQVMIVNLDSFNSDDNIMNNYNDSFGGIPIEQIAQTNPILILDEPQNMESDNAKKALRNINPLFSLRYSATHKELHNLIYRLTPFDAYDLGLVKQIEVCSVIEDTGLPYFTYIGSEQVSNKSASCTLELLNKDSIRKKFKISTTSKGFTKDGSLFEITKNKKYVQIFVKTFNKDEITLLTPKGEITVKAKVNSNNDEEKVKELMIYETVKAHLEKEIAVQNESPRIKVLSLFFIDTVSKYNSVDSCYKKYFNNAISRLSKNNRYTKIISDWGSIENVHSGYFSKNTKESATISKAEQKDLYDLILKDKERLLNLSEPLRFIFSHSALREGWDNPNVFQICTLNETYSEIKKRQEIGRGLRLCVNEKGERVVEHDGGSRVIVADNENNISYKENKINILTVIANESYESFVKNLQDELENDTGIKSKKITPKNANNKKTIKLKNEQNGLNNPLLVDLFNLISYKSEYLIQIKGEDKVVEAIVNGLNEDSSLVNIQSAKAILIDRAKLNNLKGNYSRHSDYENIDKPQPFILEEVISEISSKTNLPKDKTLIILKNLNKTIINGLFVNKDVAIRLISDSIKAILHGFFYEGIKYVKLDNNYDLENIFPKEIPTNVEDKFLINTENDNSAIYDKIICDSENEKLFLKNILTNSKIKLVVKFPPQFTIATPIGSYNPDWGLVKSNSNDFELEYIYLVKETKFNSTETELKAKYPEQWQKVSYAKKHFGLTEFKGFSVVSGKDEI